MKKRTRIPFARITATLSQFPKTRKALKKLAEVKGIDEKVLISSMFPDFDTAFPAPKRSLVLNDDAPDSKSAQKLYAYFVKKVDNFKRRKK